MLWVAVAVLLLLFAGVSAGCISTNRGEWYLSEAPLPEGWPDLTPVGEVQVKPYPAYRAAVVDRGDREGDAMNPMFSSLFSHIKKRDIAMTAPVEMGYSRQANVATNGDTADAGSDATMSSMAFLYRSTDQGKLEDDGSVTVRDLPAQTFASIGVRGSYTDENFATNLDALKAWLEEHTDEWQADGPPRYLGYNSPFVPWFMRYGEVQIPVRDRRR